MTANWFEDSLGNEPLMADEEQDTFYCPYTNTSVCAVLQKGWQLQELCEALECEQMKFIQRHKRRRREAA